MGKIKRFLGFVIGVLKKREAPNTLNVDITSRCNLNCEHCYWRKTYDPKKEPTDKEWEKTFKKWKKKGTGSAFLTGGEPALRPNVIKIADKIFDGITIVSNGTIKIPESIQKRIFISIDGPKKIHDKIRRAKVLDKIMKNIQNDKRVVLTPTLSTTNYKYIDDLIKITRKANVDGITFSLYTSHQKKGDPLVLKGKKLDWTIKKLKEVWKKNKDIVWITPYIIKLFKTKKHYKNCFMLNKKYALSFDANMNLKTPCMMGKGVNCKTCGCIVSVMSHALSRGDIRAWILFDRFYPERYYP